MWENLHQETGVACSRNSPLSQHGRPSPSLLERTLSEQAGGPNVIYKSSLFSLRLQPPLSLPAPTLLAILSLALVGIHTSAALGHPSRNSLPLFSAGFLCFGSLEISTPIRPFNHGSRLFSLFANPAFTRQLHVKMRPHAPAFCKPTPYSQADLVWHTHGMTVVPKRHLSERKNACIAPICPT
jgi:hypothetical protein